MTAATFETAAERPRDADLGAWIAVAAGGLGALMATLDISITNSALPQIQGEVGATGTEGTWIATGYLVSEIVMIPLTAWLTRVLGLRNLLLLCAGLFVLFSIVCGTANDLTWMIIGRVGQGFVGGAMIPTGQTIVATRLPRHQQTIGLSLFALVVLAGPIIGPLTGGWLAENISWRWCFFVNLPVGLALIALLVVALPRERADLKSLLRADWLGVIGLAVGLSSLTVVLEEGQRERWFESQMIVGLSIASVVGIAVLILAQFTAKDPVVKLKLMLNPSYASVVVLVTAFGATFYGVLYLLPQFLAGIAGYNAQQSGLVLLVSGIPAFLAIAVVPPLMSRLDMRILVGAGLAAIAGACFLEHNLTSLSAGGDFTVAQLMMGFGQVLVMFPLNQASVGAVDPEFAGDAAGLFNMARNLGGSIGLASLGAVMDWRTAIHADAIRESVHANSPLAQDRLAGMAASAMSQVGDATYAQLKALRQIAGQIEQQAMVLTFSDAFWLLGVMLLLCLPLTYFLKPPAHPGDALGGH
jgi:DHA2 family multidrug resistance protein